MIKPPIWAFVLAALTTNHATAAELTISAAASLQDVLQVLAARYEAMSDDNLIVNVAASTVLAHQIANGAPVDLFVSAASAPMDALEAKGRLEPNTRTVFAQNTLVLVESKAAKLGLTSFSDLSDPRVKKIAVGAVDTVPAGQYAAAVLKALGLETKVASRLVYGSSVRHVLTYVETGNADAGIVYLTDAMSSKNVTLVATAKANWHGPIVYPLAIIAASKNKEAARRFAAFLGSTQVADVLKAHGFKTARDPS